jgi:trehalose/maltose transport system substrate-binding protein
MTCRRIYPTFAALCSRKRVLRFGSLRSLTSTHSYLLVLVLISLSSCANPARQPVPRTVTLLDPGWLNREFGDWRDQEVTQFTGETGIQVKLLPAPETAIDQLALWRKLLESAAPLPDVYAIDIYWPPLIGEYFIDLKPYVAQDTSLLFPALVKNDTVDGRLIAMPYHVDTGLLFYRTDLLRQYGYGAPPATWSDLEKMAARIQTGERAKGKKNFWGFVWQGAPSEALTCNALEWQASEGGGRIIESDKTISVNNTDAIRSWDRAARWVGSISPPSVIAYREWDALNIWRTGDAAFMRNWPTSYLVSRAEGSTVADKFDVTLLPSGKAGHVGTLGGASLSVSRYSQHPSEAIKLVRFLCRRDVQLHRSHMTTQPPTIPELYEDPGILKVNPHFAKLKQVFANGVVARPSKETGKKYIDVSIAYFNAVHSVLTHQKNAAAAAADLERALVQITGFGKRAPGGAALRNDNEPVVAE